IPLLLAGIVYAFTRSNEKFHTWFDGWVLQLPVLGVLMKKVIMARFANFFAIMYASGIPVLECLRSCENIAGNRAVREAVHEAGLQIADGGGISASFESTNLFPPLVIRMLRVGENTGALESALENVSYFYTRDVHEGIDRMQKLLLPVLTVGLGLFLLLVIVAVFKPIYDLVIQNAI
ncbi:MAG: type II secretion system F family protein, partial [Gammaproteobacteria bacterium]|nr:type II secretion system F family protein [Gammaproteobacteria bacterium]